MKNFTLKMLMMACIVLIASYSNAQFKNSSSSGIGQSIVTDPETSVATFDLSFNTTQKNSYWEQVDDTTVTVAIKTTRNNRGLRALVFAADTVGAPQVYDNKLRVYRWHTYENMAHFASIDSLEAIMAKWKEVYAGTDDSAKYTIEMPTPGLFDLDASATDQAFGVHPGKYKKVEIGFGFNYSGYIVAKDIEFEVFTYYAGNTGLTASYDLVIDVDGDTTTVADFYVTGSPKKTVKIAEILGVDIAAFNGKKVFVELKTKGTGTPIALGTVDPMIVIDNITSGWDVPQWLSPKDGQIRPDKDWYSNIDNPTIGIKGVEEIHSVLLQTKGRAGGLAITSDMVDRYDLKMKFLKEGALKGKDAEGNYTVDIPYTLKDSSYIESSGKWKKARIELPAPPSGTSVDDDMMFYFKVTPKSYNVTYERLELDMGTRIWYWHHYAALEKILVVGATPPDNILPSDSVTIATLEAAGHFVVYMDDNDATAEFDYSPYAAVVFGESCSSSKVVPFGVDSKYPIPSVMIEPLGPRYNKWGWWEQAADAATYKEDKTGPVNWNYLQVKDDHYITAELGLGKTFKFAVPDSNLTDIRTYGVDLKSVVPEAMLIASNPSMPANMGTAWAIPKGATLGVTGEKAKTRMVYLPVFAGTIANDDDDSPTFGADYSTSDMKKLILGSVEWALGRGDVKGKFDPSDEEILYLDSNAPEKIDDPIVDQLEAQGFSVTRMDRKVIGVDGIEGVRFDYSPFAAIVFSPGAGSSDLKPYAQDDYPIPAVCMKVDGVKHDKWGWINGKDKALYNKAKLSDLVPAMEDRTDGLKMVVLDDTHYITNDMVVDQKITWTTANPMTEDFGKTTLDACDLSSVGGVPLTTYAGIPDGSGLSNTWAMEGGLTLNSLRLDNSYAPITLENRIVLLAVFSDAAPFVNDNFGNLLGLSLDWVLGANITAADDIALDNDVVLYPNPASSFAKVKFTLDQASEVSLSIVNLVGQSMNIGSRQYFERGVNEISIDTNSLKEGIYIYQLKVGNNAFTGKFSVTK